MFYCMVNKSMKRDCWPSIEITRPTNRLYKQWLVVVPMIVFAGLFSTIDTMEFCRMNKRTLSDCSGYQSHSTSAATIPNPLRYGMSVVSLAIRASEQIRAAAYHFLISAITACKFAKSAGFSAGLTLNDGEFECHLCRFLDYALVERHQTIASSPPHIFCSPLQHIDNRRLLNADFGSYSRLRHAGSDNFFNKFFPVHAANYRQTEDVCQ